MKLIEKLNILVTKKEKRKGLLLTLLLLLGMIFEVLGIGLLLPILTAILNPEILFENQIIKDVFYFFDIIEPDQIVSAALITLLFVYTIKSAYLLYLSHYQNRFISRLSAELSNRLFKNYLFQSYTFHLKRNSSELIKNFQVEITYFTNFLISTILLITEVTLTLSVVSTLFLIEPLGTLIVLIFFGVSSLLFYNFTKKKISKWGSVREQIDSNISKVVLEGFSGIKEVILAGRQSYFFSQIEENNSIKASISTKNLTLRQVPRYYLELLSVFSLIGFIFIMVIQNRNIENVIVTLGVFVAATFRILPSINRILSSLQNIKFYRASIDLLYTEFKSTNSIMENYLIDEINQITPSEKISLNNLCFKFKETKKEILKNVNLDIKVGSTIGIIGSSGAGKSTLINILVGLLKPDLGGVFVDNFAIQQNNLRKWQNSIGYVSQDVYLTDDSIVSNIAFGIEKEKIDFDLIDKVLNQAQLTDLIQSLPNGYNTEVGERGVQLSGGQQQRIGIARALYKKPEVLVLDEATSALDTGTEHEIMSSVDLLKGKKTIIIVTHRMITLKNCDQIYKLEKGKLNLENKQVNIH
ncbi:MAG: ABC transporter ATP-binding protein [Flavobacteriaceae bacterium]|nr:ABC transporter ATP-binding protein [Flavobacteriaceae bacterium]